MWIYTSLHCFIVKPYTTLLHTHISKSQKLVRTVLIIQGSHQRPDSDTKAIENTIQMAPKLFLATQHHSPPHAIYHTEQRHIQPHQSTTQMRVSRVRPPSNGDPRALIGQGCNGMEHTCAVKKKIPNCPYPTNRLVIFIQCQRHLPPPSRPAKRSQPNSTPPSSSSDARPLKRESLSWRIN